MFHMTRVNYSRCLRYIKMCVRWGFIKILAFISLILLFTVKISLDPS